ncbi:hypothetical protein CLOSYM_03117 [[Clostridium] symbiosum ATCC 14940]|uniref:Uncharacterized protein n=1 Tax=[Clostridium] symbiosum ATCC 14940 TaxID=411472 RepID=A0ABC9TVF6_CLOSY|nr:hypothetical protein CLOSYM_03117 [[Clostridium] symbiosum ATCC 14940]
MVRSGRVPPTSVKYLQLCFLLWYDLEELFSERDRKEEYTC